LERWVNGSQKWNSGPLYGPIKVGDANVSKLANCILANQSNRHSLAPYILAFVSFLVTNPASPSSTTAPAITGGEWEGYNKSLDGQRYSQLSEINAANAETLTETCRVEIARRGSFEAGLVVVENTMFATTDTDTIALDPVTCAVKWRHAYLREYDPIVAVNRGVAYLNGRIFRGTDDGRLLALDAQTGKEIWRNVVGDPRLGEALTGAPIAWNGLVIVGTAASDFGIRGRIAGYDASSGRELWRFNTIPIAGDKGAESWKDSNWAKHGGGGTWSSFAIDPTSGELFIPIGNPVPMFAPEDRPGANLFTDSVVVLDAQTGKLKWYYQLDPSDGLDHDLGAAPLLFRNNRSEDMVAAAGKDGFLYLIDRDAHKLQAKTAITTVDPKPVVPTPEGVTVCPGLLGGVEWNGPAFDPKRMTIFVGAVDYCSIVKGVRGSKWVPGGLSFGGSWTPVADPPTGWLTAVDGDTGRVRWKLHTDGPVLSGVTATAGGIVLVGDNSGAFYVVNSDSGNVIKKVPTGGALSGGVVTYEQNNKQYIAFATGNVSKSVFGAVGHPSIVVMAATGDASQVTATNDNSPNARRGAVLFRSCEPCHGPDGKNIGGFDLSTIRSRMDKDQLIDWIKNPAPPMPRVFPEPLDAQDERDIRDIAAFLQNGMAP
jgi:alcohol dehydrogenase (cytochrome c)